MQSREFDTSETRP
nr:unnamed protein product [Callosobruchus chinensis]